ncbi:uncharacterized protein LOC141701524 [Apium graveolens]|uniref:uncharacterized protein LOC141701524 n=1 Tax=Apium graveolens TaxID=4045 RepID=UPI003D7ADF8A
MKIYNLRFRQAYLPQIFSLQASWSNTKASRSKIRFQFGGFESRGSFDVGFSFLKNEFQSEYSKREYGESLDAQPDVFLCSINDVKVNNGVDQRARNVVPGIEGFLRQKLSSQGLAFIVRGGSVLFPLCLVLLVQKSLEVGEVLAVDVSSTIALSGTVDVHIKFNGRMRRVVFGGENVVTAAVTGPGIIFIQSMPFHRLSQRIARAVASPNMRDNPKFFFQIAIFFFLAYVVILSSLILTDI